SYYYPDGERSRNLFLAAGTILATKGLKTISILTEIGMNPSGISFLLCALGALFIGISACLQWCERRLNRVTDNAQQRRPAAAAPAWRSVRFQENGEAPASAMAQPGGE